MTDTPATLDPIEPIRDVSDEQILAAFRRGRVAVRRPNPGLEADEAPNALVYAGLEAIEDLDQA